MLQQQVRCSYINYVHTTFPPQYACSNALQQQPVAAVAEGMLQGSADNFLRGRVRRLTTGIPGPRSPVPRSRRLQQKGDAIFLLGPLRPRLTMGRRRPHPR